MASIAPARASESALTRLRALPAPLLVLVAGLLGLIGGGLTSFAQTVLPPALAPAANSSGGWTLLTVLVVALLRLRPAWSAAAATLCFTALTLGYRLVSTMRGYPTSEVLFLLAGLVVGPFVGVATAWLRDRGWRPAAAAALLGGIGVGEGLYGLLVVASSTSPVWWVLEIAGGVALAVVVCARRATRAGQRLLALGGVALVAAAFVTAYSAL